MNAFLHEYGQLIISVVVCAACFVLFFSLTRNYIQFNTTFISSLTGVSKESIVAAETAEWVH